MESQRRNSSSEEDDNIGSVGMILNPQENASVEETEMEDNVVSSIIAQPRAQTSNSDATNETAASHPEYTTSQKRRQSQGHFIRKNIRRDPSHIMACIRARMESQKRRQSQGHFIRKNIRRDPSHIMACIRARMERTSSASSSASLSASSSASLSASSSASLSAFSATECFHQTPHRSSQQDQNNSTSLISSLSLPTTLQQRQVASLPSSIALPQLHFTPHQTQRTTLTSSSATTMQSQRYSLSASSASSQSQMTTSEQHQQVNVAVSAVSSQSHPTTQQSQQTEMSTSLSQPSSEQQTSDQQVSQPLTKENHNAMKVFLIIDQEARPVMKEVFEAGAKSKKPNETLKDYLFRYKGMINAQYRQTFNRTQREKIESDPSCQTFDVSLWLQAIQQGCDGLAAPGDEVWLTSNTLENLLKQVKDFRNNMFHGDLWLDSSDFLEKTEAIRTLLLDCLTKAREKFSLNKSYIDKKISDLNSRINFIRDNPLTELDLNMYDNSVLFTGLQNILLTKGYDDLLHWFKRLIHVNLTSIIVGQDIHVKVDAIFTPLEIIQAERGEENLTIRYNDLIYEAHQNKQRDGTCVGQIILLEGVAGSGKTTLIKQLLSAWASKQNDVREINLYKFIIPIECRSRSYLELSNVISSLMPTARKSFQNIKHMQECVLDLPSIIIMDGLDEMNDVSQKLFSEIMEIKNTENLTIICTTRPEKIQDFYCRIPDDVKTMHIKIKGIAEKSIENFIYKYHEALRACGKSKQSTEGLLHYYRTRGIRLKHLFICPLYASLMCILWAVAPDVVNNITTETELLLEISKLSMEKLLERLTKHDLTKHLPIHSLKKKLEEFKEFLCKIALHCLRDDVVILNDNETQSLENKCNDLQLPHDEVLGAFLNCENSWNSTSMKALLSFPHKSIQDFYACLFIYGKVKSNDAKTNFINLEKNMRDAFSSCKVPVHIQQRTIESLLKDLKKYEEDLSAHSDEKNVLESIFSEAFAVDFESLSLNRFQNVFSMLIGIMYHYGHDIDDKLGKKLVDLLEKSGITNREQFVQVLSSVKCNDSLVRLIAQIPGIMEGTIEIGSDNTFAYASLFKITKPESVVIDIYDDPSVVPRHEELILTISNYQSQVENLSLHYLFRYPEVSIEKTSLGNNIKQMMKLCPVMRYTGSMMTEISFSHSLTDLYVSVTTKEEIKTLNSFIKQSHTLRRLHVCVSADVDHMNFIPIHHPITIPPYLYIVDLTMNNLMNCVNIIKSLQPMNGHKRFDGISFPRCNINPLDLIESLGRMMMGIKCDFLLFPSSLKPQQQQQKQLIQEEAKRILGCINVY